MRLVFAGTPEFARAALESLHTAGHELALVLTQPDRPAGRGLKLQPSPVKQFALAHAMPVAQPRSLRLDGKYPQDAQAAQQALQAARPQALVVAAYGLILPQWVLDVAPLGAFNIHASLLPRWRGAAPIHRAVEAGDAQTGITIMQMDAGLDTGAMLLTQAIAIEPVDTTGSLHDKLAPLGGELMVQALALAEAGRLQPQTQPPEGITYAHKIDKAEAQLDWSQPAAALARKVRSLDPAPGAASALGGEVIKLWRCEIDSAPSAPGVLGGTILHVTEAAVTVACGSGALRLTELQRPGGKRLPVADFLRGFELRAGMVFGPPSPTAAA